MDFIEIPLLDLDVFDAEAIRSRLEGAELGAVTSTVLLGDTDITSGDANIRKKGVDYLKDCVKATSDIGSNSFSGVIYSQHVKQALSGPASRTGCIPPNVSKKLHATRRISVST